MLDRRRLGLILAVVGVAGSLSACAYRLGTGDRRLPGGYREIAVPVFSNLTQETGIETDFTNALIRRFSRSQVAKVVEKEIAPVKIEGRILKLTETSRFAGKGGEITTLPSQTVLTTEYRLEVQALVVVKRTSDQAVLWQGNLRGERVYPAPRIGAAVLNSANALYNQSARKASIADLAVEMMDEAHDLMTENF